MIGKSILHVLLFALPLSLGATPAASVLLRGNVQKQEGTKSIVSGSASAIVKGTSEEMRILAPEITFDPQANALECSGDVTITAAGRTIRGKDLRVELGSDAARVFVVIPNSVTLDARTDPGLPML